MRGGRAEVTEGGEGGGDACGGRSWGGHYLGVLSLGLRSRMGWIGAGIGWDGMVVCVGIVQYRNGNEFMWLWIMGSGCEEAKRGGRIDYIYKEKEYPLSSVKFRFP